MNIQLLMLYSILCFKVISLLCSLWVHTRVLFRFLYVYDVYGTNIHILGLLKVYIIKQNYTLYKELQ